jgi:SSS family solute:Na+ symporter
MVKKVAFTLLLILGFTHFSRAETPAPDFFKFTEGGAPSAELLSLMDSRSGSVSVFQSPETVILAGGQDSRAVVRYQARAGGYVSENLPDLPVALSGAGAAISGNGLYVAGGHSGSEANTALFRLDLSRPDFGWLICSTVPAEIGDRPVLVDLHGVLYVTGFGVSGTETYSYNSVRNEWKPMASAPEDMSGFTGVSCGDAHLLFFNASNPDDRILAYHRISDVWFEMGRLPQVIFPFGAVSSGTEFTVLSPSAVIGGKALLTPTKYGIYDHLVVAVLLISLVGVGLFFAKKEKSSGDYFRAGKRIPWWAAGLSLFASGASAISLMAMPGKAYAENWIYFSSCFFVVIIQLPLLFLVYVPIIRRLNCASANEYLEKRFNLPIRMLGSLIYSLNQMLGRMAAILLLPAIALSSIFGLPIEQSILIMGVVSTIYVTLGGLEAVIWTDVLQAVVMLAAVIVCACWAFFSLDMTAASAMEILAGQEKLRLFDFSFDWTAPVFIICVTNVLSASLGMIGDQNFLQRVQCTPDPKDARKAVLTQLGVAIPLNAVLFALGTLLFLFYRSQPQTLSPALKSDGIFPFFAAQHLPPGMAGFVVAALFAATISTVSGAVNSVANLGVEDIYRRFFRKVTDHRCLVVGKVLTLSLGVFGTGAALLLARTGLLSIWDLALMITGIILAPVSGIFVLGIFTRRANSFGIWVGTVASILANVYAKLYLNLHSLAFLTVGVFTCIVVGYLASFLAPKSRNQLDGLTVFTLFNFKSHSQENQ